MPPLPPPPPEPLPPEPELDELVVVVLAVVAESPQLAAVKATERVRAATLSRARSACARDYTSSGRASYWGVLAGAPSKTGAGTTRKT